MRDAALVMAVVLVLCACSGAESKPKPQSEAREKLYTLTGRVVTRDAGDNTLRVDHEAIPGFMQAMTMDYSVRGTKVASLPADGTRVEAQLHVTSDGYWLTGVKKVK
jgi:protein SCO1